MAEFIPRSLFVAPGFATVCGDSPRFLRGEPGTSALVVAWLQPVPSVLLPRRGTIARARSSALVAQPFLAVRGKGGHDGTCPDLVGSRAATAAVRMRL